MSTKLVKKTLDIFNYKNIKNEYREKKIPNFFLKIEQHFYSRIHTHTPSLIELILSHRDAC